MIEKILENYKAALEKEKSIVLSIKVSTKMPKTSFISQMENGTLKLNVCSAPEKGKANKEIIKFLSKQFSVHRNNIDILSGKTSNLKLIKIIRAG